MYLCTYCVHACFYIVLMFKKYLTLTTYVFNLFSYIYSYTGNPTPKP